MIKEVIEELNRTYGNSSNCVIELLKWETDAAPGISSSGSQELINSDIGDEYDIFLGMFWMNYGTPTDKANSGTEEEFNRALERFKRTRHSPQIMFYFKSTPPSSLNNINIDSFSMIQRFKIRLKEEGILYWSFDSIEEFQQLLRLHIHKRIDPLNKIDSSIKETVDSSETNNLPPDEDFGILDYSDQFEAYITESKNSLLKISESTKLLEKNINDNTLILNKYTTNHYANKKALYPIINRISRQITDYSERLKVETPIFFNTFEEGIKAGVSLVLMTDEFLGEKTITDLEESKISLMLLLDLMPKTISALIVFRDSVSGLPRVQKELNVAKRELVKQLNDLIDKIAISQDLVLELSIEVDTKLNLYKTERE